MGKPEGRIENHLIKRCKQHGFLTYKFTSPGHRGVPDRIVIGNNHTIFIELKSATGTLSPLQKTTINKMKKAGANVFVCKSKNEVDKIINMISTNKS